MGQLSTLQRVVTDQLRVFDIDLAKLLNEYPTRSFVDIQEEIAGITGIVLSSRTLRRWFNDTEPTSQEAAS